MDKLLNSVKQIQGFKSYGVIAAMFVVSLLGDVGTINPDQSESWMRMLEYALGGTLTAKANRLIQGLKSV
jgi:hypothetical protein